MVVPGRETAAVPPRHRVARPFGGGAVRGREPGEGAVTRAHRAARANPRSARPPGVPGAHEYRTVATECHQGLTAAPFQGLPGGADDRAHRGRVPAGVDVLVRQAIETVASGNAVKVTIRP